MKHYLIYIQKQRAVDLLSTLQQFGKADLLDFTVVTLETSKSMTEIQHAMHAADTSNPINYIMVEVADRCYRGDGHVASAAALLS